VTEAAQRDPRRSRSLLWRLGALALVVTSLTLVLHVTTVNLLVRPMTDYVLEQLDARVHLTRSLIAVADPVSRDQVAASVSDFRFTVRRGRADASTVTDRETVPYRLGPPLLNQLGPEFDVLQEVSEECCFGARALIVVFLVDGEPWRIRLLVQPPFLALSVTVVGWLLMIGFAVGGTFMVGSRFIVGPLRTVSNTMMEQDQALQPIIAPPGSSAEVLAFVDSFNRLVERVRAADRTKHQMLAGVSHDLRTPLSRLRLRIETQCTAAVADAASEELRAVEHIVSQFMSFVQGDREAGSGAAQSLISTCRQVVTAYRGDGVDVDFVPFGQDIEIGAVGLQRLLTNLLDNAVHYGVQPIEVVWQQLRGGRGELVVWDHGNGLTESEFDQARQPFVRLSHDVEIGHCGLGLAIVEQIALQWRGRIETRRDELGRFGVAVVWPLGDVPVDRDRSQQVAMPR
jgi:two-component system, OmpR family, osmolarity sensor histidine kinase EnvZ